MFSEWMVVLMLLLQSPSGQAQAQPARPGRRPAVTTQPAAAQPRAAQPRTAQPEPGTPPRAAQPVPVLRPRAAQRTEADMTLDLSGRDVDIQIMDDGTIILQGADEDIAALERIIDQIDVPPTEKMPRIFRLENSQAAAIAPKLLEIIDSIIPAERRRPEDEVTITAEPRANLLLVVASPAQMERIALLVPELDQPFVGVAGGEEIREVPIQNMKASEAGDQLRSLLEELQKKRGDTGPLPVNIMPNDRTNSLLISAPAADFAEILKLLKFIDVELQEGMRSVAKMVIIPLVRTKAQEMADVLQEMIEAQGRQSGELKEQIRRLRLLRVEEEGKITELPEVDLEKPIRILPDPGTNSVIIGTSEENIGPFTELVKLLDTVPIADEMSVRIFPLKHADAGDTKDLLENMFQKGKDLPAQPSGAGQDAVPQGVTGKALVYNVSVVADPRTNTVVVSGRMEQILLAQELINNIDVPQAATRYPFRIVKLEHAGAARIHEVLQEIVEKRKETLDKLQVGPAAMEREAVFLIPEVRSNSLVISANDENFEELAELARQLDTVGDRLIEDIRIIKLEKATAVDLKDKIEALWERRTQLLGEQADVADTPVVVADARSNSLVVASSPEDFESIRVLIERLEALPLSPMADIRLIPLKYNDAGEVSQMLETLFSERLQMSQVEGQSENPADRVAVVHDAATNSVIVASSRENYDLMLKLIREVDVDLDVEGLVKTFVIEYTDATTLADRLKELFDAGIVKPGARDGGEIRKELERVVVVPDARSNTLIISASRQNFQIAEELIKKLDDPDAPSLIGFTRIFGLEHADAVKLADILTQLFEGLQRTARDESIFVEPTIIPDARSNTLVVAGSKDALARAESMIAELDVEARTPPSAIVKVYTLQYAAATKLAPMMSDLFEKREREGAEEINKTPIFLQAEESSNALIVSASREDHVVVGDLLQLLDVPSKLEEQMRIFPLSRGNAEDLAERLTELFEARGAGGGEAGAGVSSMTGVGITPDLRTNALIVRASPTEMENIAKIVERLDTSEPTKELMISHVKLEQADAQELADVLREALQGGEGERAVAADQAVIYSYVQKAVDGQPQIRKLLRENLTLVPDPRTNSLLIIAPPPSVEMLDGLIRQLDAIKPEVAKIRVFTLRNANAEDMVTTLEEVFQPEERRGAGGEGEAQRELALEGGVAAGGRQALAFTVDQRTNSVIAAGTDEYLDLAENLIQTLDARDVDERVSRVYAIRHGTAENLAEALSQFIEEQTQRYERAGDQAALQRQIEREVSVVPVEDTNSLILDFDPRRESEVMNLVRQLDRPPPQVMVQVLLAEVSLDERLELGIEWAAQDLLFTETGNNFDFVAGTDVGAPGSGGLAGFSFTITGEDFNFLLRMLQTEGNLEILSRPQILVQDNQEANISIADDVPFVRGVTVTESGSTQSQVEYEEVGIIVDVTPHINPDGFVTMEIAPEISNISDSSITITEGLTAPVFNRRSAETTVTVRDGETVVIGGLIQTRDTSTESKVPVAGDLPGLGLFFRSQTKSRRKSELLIVLTPRVVRTPEDALAISLETRDVQGMIPEDTLYSPLFQGLQLRPGEPRLGAEEEAWPEPLPAEGEPQPQPDSFAPKLEKYGPGRPQVNAAPVPGWDETASPVRPARYDTYPLRNRERRE